MRDPLQVVVDEFDETVERVIVPGAPLLGESRDGTFEIGHSVRWYEGKAPARDFKAHPRWIRSVDSPGSSRNLT